MSNTFEGALRVKGALTPDSINYPAGGIVDANVNAAAAVAASKLEHQHEKTYEQESDTTSAAETRVVHVCHGETGEVIAFDVGSITVCTSDAEITVDLLKNGSSILTAAVVLDDGNTIRVVEAGTLAGGGAADLVAGDVLEVDVAVAAGGGALGKGVFAQVVVREDAS